MLGLAITERKERRKAETVSDGARHCRSGEGDGIPLGGHREVSLILL
jgi:hypothetical protein